MTVSSVTGDAEAVLQLEQARCIAINEGDGAALESTLSVDYVHVHTDGNIDDRTRFIAGILSNPRTVERGSIAVRLYANVAILIGEQTNRRSGSVMVGVMQQVVSKQDGRWQFVSAQMTRKG